MKIHKNIECNYIVSPVFNEGTVEKHKKAISDGNIQSKLDVIMHNQLVLNEKLNKLLDKKV